MEPTPTLPTEITDMILTFAVHDDAATQACAALVCHAWNDVLDNDLQTPEACAAAAKHGYLQVLQWLHENKCPWNVHACSFAACFGHLDVLRYLRENGCPWDRRVHDMALCHRHMDILQYLRGDGYWDNIKQFAARRGDSTDTL